MLAKGATGEFQILQLVFLAAFRAVDEPLASNMMVHFKVYIL